MIAEDHLITTHNREIDFILIGAVRIIPDTTSAGNNENRHTLNKSVAPKRTKEEDVKPNQCAIIVATDTGKDTASRSHIGSS